MARFEYKVIPAPRKAGKIKGVRGTENKFAAELARLMNELGADGWEYLRADTLPVEERQGLTGRTTTFQNMLVFRRLIVEAVTHSVDKVEEISEMLAPAAPVERAHPQPAPQEKAPVFSFRSANTDPAPAAEGPGLTATKAAPEGNAPAIRFRPSDSAASQ